MWSGTAPTPRKQRVIAKGAGTVLTYLHEWDPEVGTLTVHLVLNTIEAIPDHTTEAAVNCACDKQPPVSHHNQASHTPDGSVHVGESTCTIDWHRQHIR